MCGEAIAQNLTPSLRGIEPVSLLICFLRKTRFWWQVRPPRSQRTPRVGVCVLRTEGLLVPVRAMHVSLLGLPSPGDTPTPLLPTASDCLSPRGWDVSGVDVGQENWGLCRCLAERPRPCP